MEATALLIVTTAVFAAEKMTLGQMWRGNEHARKVLGVGSALLILLLGVALGLVDFNSWAMMLAVFAVAGSIDLAWEVTINERQRQAEAAQHQAVIQQLLMERANNGAANPSGGGVLREHDSEGDQDFSWM